MNIEQRLSQLEKELAASKRRHRWTLSVLLLILTLGLLTQGYSSPGADQPPLHEVRAQQFVLVDERGNIRGRLGMIDNEPTLLLRDEHSEIRIGRRTDRYSTFLGINDVRGEIRLGLRTARDGPVLFLQDERGGEVTGPLLDNGLR
ncbi:hypothetical protein [Thiorhodospira sibirica]|uniref:hypothetical protein n=1 Tax=Thiorhodospira sibirica TaxID=154347 RepID=UPI00022C5DDC|nr:hypothetical protein [Thiorhodospira sibirica]